MREIDVQPGKTTFQVDEREFGAYFLMGTLVAAPLLFIGALIFFYIALIA